MKVIKNVNKIEIVTIIISLLSLGIAIYGIIISWNVTQIAQKAYFINVEPIIDTYFNINDTFKPEKASLYITNIGTVPAYNIIIRDYLTIFDSSIKLKRWY